MLPSFISLSPHLAAISRVLSHSCHSMPQYAPSEHRQPYCTTISSFCLLVDCERSVVTLPTLWQDYKHAVVKKSAVLLRVFSNFENPCSARRQDCLKAGLRTWLLNYEWWWWYWHNLQICHFLLFAAHHISAFIQCERRITNIQINKTINPDKIV